MFKQHFQFGAPMKPNAKPSLNPFNSVPGWGAAPAPAPARVKIALILLLDQTGCENAELMAPGQLHGDMGTRGQGEWMGPCVERHWRCAY